jgi:hypothetical protein
MKNFIQLLKKAPWHLFLFSIYPILELWLLNIEQVSSRVIFRPMFFALIGAILLWRLSAFILKDAKRAAILTTIFIIAFFTYGHVYLLLKNVQIAGTLVFRHRTLFVLWVLIGVLAYFLIKKSKRIDAIHSALNWMSVLLMLIFSVELINFQLTQIQSVPKPDKLTYSSQAPDTLTGLPDVYYIILDGYGRSDMLKQEMGYDNSAFISGLEELGFYVAEHSQSNYSQTTLSLGSSLNYDYLETLGVTIDEDKLVRRDVYSLISDNSIRGYLEERGYKTVAFATGFVWSEFKDAEYFLQPEPGAKLNEFEYLLLQTTMVRIPLDYKRLFKTDLRNELFRERTEFTLEKLKTIPSISGPKFVFAHILVPHLPFVFGANGEDAEMDFKPELEYTEEEFIYGYTNQVTFVNKQVLEVVRELIEKSQVPPIIIIQGDHGFGRFGREARMRILNAYYLPGQPDVLYDTISPVNSFRVVLNTYFDQSLPILEDRSYFSGYNNPQNFDLIENPYIEK